MITRSASETSVVLVKANVQKTLSLKIRKVCLKFIYVLV